MDEREGVAAIALLAMYADGVIASEEDEQLRDHLAGFPLFAGLDEERLGEMLVRLERLSRERGGEALLASACASVGERLRPTAFYVAADIIASDGRVELAESTFLRALRVRLALPDAEAQRIVDVVGLKSRR